MRQNIKNYAYYLFCNAARDDRLIQEKKGRLDCSSLMWRNFSTWQIFSTFLMWKNLPLDRFVSTFLMCRNFSMWQIFPTFLMWRNFSMWQIFPTFLMWRNFSMWQSFPTFIMWRNLSLDNISWGEFLHMTNFFSKDAVCGVCDKYQVCMDNNG